MYPFKIKLFQTQRTMQFLPKSFLKLLRDCKSKIECFKDDRGICFCTRTPQVVVSYNLLLQMAILTEVRYLQFSLK